MKTDETLKELCPQITLGVLYYKANVEKTTGELLKEFNHTILDLEEEYQLEDISKQEHIKTTREAYLKMGKSPSEYRNAAEAMLRRIVKGKGLYQINNVVEVNNIISIRSGYSIGTYDIDCLKGEITLKHAPIGEKYQGIGKDDINIENLPTLYDEEGPFGNPTSDSRKAMITQGEHNLMMVIYSFDGDQELDHYLDDATLLLKKYCHAENIEREIIN